jgi:hypothetical protein
MRTFKPLTPLTVIIALACASTAFAEGGQVAENNPIGDPPEDTYLNPYAYNAYNADNPGYLENPQPNSAQSGIGVVSGWQCDAQSVEFQIDDGRLVPIAYGTERKDTEPVCGDVDNGFVFLLNYSGMGDGWHLITVYSDGEPFGAAAFFVKTLGDKFVRGLEAVVEVPDFPYPGDTAVLRWDEAKQNFSIESVE